MGTPKYDVDESKERDATYSAPLRVRVRLINKERDEIKEQEVFMGELPLMTETGTFIINGAERVIVSQLVRSPSVYFTEDDKLKVKNIPNAYKTTVIPNRGAWLEFEKGHSPEARFARVIDALVPLINHLEVSELNYNPDNISADMVLEKKKFIKSESEELWKLTEDLIQESVERGLYFLINDWLYRYNRI